MLAIRPAAVADAGVVVAMHHLPHAREFVVAPSHEQVMRAIQSAHGEHHMVIQEGEVVGFIMFAQIEPWLYEIRRVVSLREGLGVASFALAWTLEHLFRQRAAHRVYLEVLRAINARAAYTNGMALSWKGPIETVIAPHSNEKACFRS